jgi:hypothetical protein
LAAFLHRIAGSRDPDSHWGYMHVGVVVFSSTFIGSLIAGILSGGMLARYRNMRGGLAVLLVFGLCVFSFILCFVGCAFTIK